MKQDIKSETTQQLIIDKSFKLIYKNGYSSTSIPDIMKETNLSKGAFYHHFKSKNEIGKIMISQIIKKRIYNGMIAPLHNYKNENTIDLLLNVFTNRVHNFSEEEKKLGCPANNLINEIGCSDAIFRTILRQLIEDWKAMLIKVIDYGKHKKEIKAEISSSATAIYLISAFEGIRGIRKVYDNDDILFDYLGALKNNIRQLA